ncbi:MAG: type IIL restriction-modification enzyme MmeI [Byssovorax sp.]
MAALRALAARWADAKARERGNFHLYMGELCDALGVESPRPAGSGYEYELPIRIVDREGKERTNFADLYKRECFLLEAKDSEAGHSDELMLRKAFGQVRNYVTHLPGSTPPYLIILDIGKTLVVWDRWEGGFGGYAAGKRIVRRAGMVPRAGRARRRMGRGRASPARSPSAASVMERRRDHPALVLLETRNARAVPA